ncbi:hypothetical protein BD413DRAFT_89552 [Trametes elegans]|nr:hypothetical protein BD413DRAFT_89552 [Trametes elegans]
MIAWATVVFPFFGHSKGLWNWRKTFHDTSITTPPPICTPYEKSTCLRFGSLATSFRATGPGHNAVSGNPATVLDANKNTQSLSVSVSCRRQLKWHIPSHGLCVSPRDPCAVRHLDQPPQCTVSAMPPVRGVIRGLTPTPHGSKRSFASIQDAIASVGCFSSRSAFPLLIG